jgi:hypothetical protein
LLAARTSTDLAGLFSSFTANDPQCVIPLVLAQGAGGAGSISVGTIVFGGMIAATTLNLLFIPVLYVIVRSIVPGRATPPAAQTSH